MQNKIYLSNTEILKIKQALTKPDGIIAFPTDTVYGIGCLIKNQEAVKKIYTIKNRDISKPLILLGSCIDSLLPYTNKLPKKLYLLAKKHWPGALTIILPRNELVPSYVNSSMPTVGLRVPNHPVTLEILKYCVVGNVLATTSANYSCQKELLFYTDVKNLLEKDINFIVKDYNIPICATPSTIVTLNEEDDSIKILRQGTIMID